jgi:trimethylamine--corrinoid protein Co-methyltransferase
MLMTPPTIAFSPVLTALSENDRRTIYHAALWVLAHTGMILQHEDAIALLKDAGCRRTGDGALTIPQSLVDEALRIGDKP